MNKLNQNKLYKIAIGVFSVLLWILIWYIAARIFDFEIIFPGPKKTLNTLLYLITLSSFWKSVLYSFYRIVLGLLVGIVAGIVLTIISRLLIPIHTFISIGMSVIKSTPVASIVLILWVLVDGAANLPVIIAFLMVMPIIWQNLTDGFNSIDQSLVEVARVFQFSKSKTARIVYFPTLLNHFIPALLTSIGLAWKAGISAEVIAYTKNSIGASISDARANFDGDILFAWTLVVVGVSLLLEYIVRLLLRRFRSKNA